MPTQKALYLQEAKGDFALGDAPIYKPGAGELLVKIHSASLNPVDWKIQRWAIFIEKYPVILGADGAGEVVQVGEGVTEFQKGDKVFFQGLYEPTYTTFQQYALADAAITAKIPDNISYDQAVSIPVASTTAYVGLYKGFGLTTLTTTGKGAYANTPIVILGGSSSVGQYGIQFAKASGFTPIITTSSLKHTEYLKSLGATHVIDRNLPLPTEVSKITDKPILHVLDAISLAETQQAAYDLLGTGGTVSIVLPEAIVRKDDERKEVFYVHATRNNPTHRELLVDAYEHISDWLKTGLLQPNRVQVVPGGLAGIEAGLRRLESDQVSGIKLVAHPQDTIA